MEIKLLELFGGIGACTKAIERLGIKYQVVDYVENDKYAVNSYNAIHNTNFKPQDIRDWDKAVDIDLIMHGSPCQDFSLAGKQKGGDKGSGTRSSLMYETLRIVEKLKPKYVIWENVKNIISKRHIHNFNAYVEEMKNYGYKSFYKVMNASDYGIPQHRERVITISIRDDIENSFEFPKAIELKKPLKEFLEKNVDESYYLSPERIKKITKEDVNSSDFIPIKNCTKKGYLEATDGDGCYISAIDKKRGTVQKNMIPTIKTSLDIGVVEKKMNEFKIRRLTPRECWRLMGFDDKDFDKANAINSNVQLYKQVGNSIVVNVLEEVIKSLLKGGN